MSGEFSTCGVPYTIHSDGKVEVNGEFPAYTDPSIQKRIATIWTDWGGTIADAARKNGMAPAWLVGIIYIESGGKPRASAACEPTYCPGVWKTGACAAQGGPEVYCAGGLMAFTSGTARMWGKSIEYYMDHPDEMIHAAAAMIMTGAPSGKVYGGGVVGHNGDLLTVVKMYNGGASCGGSGITGHGGQGDYVSKFVKVCNTFVGMGLAPSAGAFGSAPLVTAIFIGMGLAAYLVADMYWDITGRIEKALP